MAYSKTESIALDIAKPIAEENGCYVYDVEFVKEGGVYFLRIYVDREGGIDLDMCEKVSRAVSEKLDVTDPIKQNYYLEVSSPGVERRLRMPEHFKRYIGSVVDVGFYKAVNGSKQLTGVLSKFDDGNICIEQENGFEMCFNQKETTFVKLHFDF